MFLYLRGVLAVDVLRAEDLLKEKLLARASTTWLPLAREASGIEVGPRETMQ